MGFSSMDDFINEVTTNGQFWRADWNKNVLPTTAQTAGMWYDLYPGAGNPSADALYGNGTNLAIQPLHDALTGAVGIGHGGNVTPATKHIINASSYSAAGTTMPAVFMLVDLLAFYPVTTITSTSNQTLVNSVTFTADSSTELITYAGWDIPSLTGITVTNAGGGLPAPLAISTTYWTVRQGATTSKLATTLANAIANVTIDITTNGTGTQTLTVPLPRYTDGKGVRPFVVCSSGSATTPMGAATPNISMTYTRPTTGGTDTGRTTPTVLPIGNSAAIKSNIVYSGTAAGKYGPFMPLQGGDNGVVSAQGFQLSISYATGVLNLVLCKPLLTLPMTTVGVAAERDLMNQVPSLPRVYDGAVLSWLMYAGANTPTSSAFYGHLDFGWG